MNPNSRSLRALLAVVACGGMLLSFSCGELETTTVFSPEGTETKIILVRHAERDDGLDPPLNEEGLVRAQALADELADDGVTAVYYPALIRNRETADPLVDATDARRFEYSAAQTADTKALANSFVNQVLNEHAGEVVLWIGNTGPIVENVQSGNLQEIYARLGGTGTPPTRYQALYTVLLTDSAPPVITEVTYGGESSLD